MSDFKPSEKWIQTGSNIYNQNSNGAIGIGTTSPSQKLTVSGGAFAVHSTTANLINASGTSVAIGGVVSAGQSLTVYSGAMVLYADITNSGLIVQPTAPASSTIHLKTFPDGATTRNFAFRNRYNALGRLELMSSTGSVDDPLTTIMRWDQPNGDTTVDKNLNVTGSIATASTVIASGGVTSNDFITLKTNATLAGYVGRASGFITAGQNDELGMRSENRIYLATSGDAGPVVTVDGSAGGGKVGVGTTIPTQKLTVSGGAFAVHGGSPNLLIVSGNGIGIGAAPQAAADLDINRAVGTAKLRILASDGTNDPWVNFEVDNTEFAVGIDKSDSSKFKISAADTVGTSDLITITTGIAVGIGTSGPTSRLQIGGALDGITAAADGISLRASGSRPFILEQYDKTSATETLAVGHLSSGTAPVLAVYKGNNATDAFSIETFRVNAIGGVGVNTANPGSNFMVANKNIIVSGTGVFQAGASPGINGTFVGTTTTFTFSGGILISTV